jgi:D-arabinose 1-dehydrogenase-like Zn-dependent alcohol dehydrogenase
VAFNGVYPCDLRSGEWIAMIGCGGLGQFGIQYAKAMGLKVVGLGMKDTVLSAAKVSTASTGDVN